MIYKITKNLTPDSQEWHECRKNVIGASEIAMLFDLSPSKQGKFWLYHYKKGNVSQDLSDVPAVQWGKRVEGAILDYAKSEFGLEFLDIGLIHVSGEGMGWTPDAIVVNHENKTVAPLQAKEVGDFVFSRGWQVDNGDVEVPLHYQLQMQQENVMLRAIVEQICPTYTVEDKSYLVAKIGNSRPPKMFESEYRPSVANEIKARVKDFWMDFYADVEPPVTNGADGDLLVLLIGKTPPKTVTADIELAELLAEYGKLKDAIKESEALVAGFEDRAKDIKAKVLSVCGGASEIYSGDDVWKLNIVETKGGTYIRASGSYSTLKRKGA